MTRRLSDQPTIPNPIRPRIGPRPGQRALTLAAALLGTVLVPGRVLAQDAPGAPAAPLTKVASFDHQVTGVTVSRDGRIFVNFPRWTEDTEVSVAELKDGKLVPFPDAAWNAWRNARKDEVAAKDHWVCVQSVVAGPNGNLWVLDPAAPAMGALVPGGPKLIEIDLKTNQPARTIAFDESVAPQGSYLNDVRFSPDGKTAYLTDSGAKGALVVVDLDGGRAHRVLDGDPSTQPDKSVTVTYDGKPLRRPDGRGVEFAADGIALSPDGKTLYWQAIKGKTLYSLPTETLAGSITTALMPTALADKSVAGRIDTVGENGPADGLIISRKDGRMYVTSPQDDSIKVRDLSAKGNALSTVVQDKRLRWPDTFAEGPDGTLYFTTSHIQDSAFYKPGAPAALPTELWSFKPGATDATGSTAPTPAAR
ncbi:MULTISPECIES: L-dopachrome tautomerase-related protein [Methylobacterium]|uniref:L-dopachrome tautomerase-related protein n=1 Tax=Methylobacterium TaxID=407 RepID=UPI0009EC269D|nr:MULTISPECIES: L-dopachrome tautomerase-related protein [Methylobacterium]MCI9879401.1 PD40 domain-containing protein [Methylobacterium goesingense]